MINHPDTAVGNSTKHVQQKNIAMPFFHKSQSLRSLFYYETKLYNTLPISINKMKYKGKVKTTLYAYANFLTKTNDFSAY